MTYSENRSNIAGHEGLVPIMQPQKPDWLQFDLPTQTLETNGSIELGSKAWPLEQNWSCSVCANVHARLWGMLLLAALRSLVFLVAQAVYVGSMMRARWFAFFERQPILRDQQTGS